MNFQDLRKVEPYKRYLDFAFSSASKKADEARASFKGPKLDKSKKIELIKIKEIELVLTRHLKKIISCFPNLENLPEFYQELVKTTLDYKELKKSLGALNWAIKKTKDFSIKYKNKINSTYDISVINKHRRDYYGRISSVVKQMKKSFETIENARKVMKQYPNIKTGLFTVCISGFPNVGKSTLLKKLTGAKPEIKAYAFTTKGINLGYTELHHHKTQFIDTPGTLNRPEKMNPIEKIAHLAMKYQANLIIYIFDLTEAGSSLKEQQKLLKDIKNLDKDVIVYLSKTDMMKKERCSEFAKKKKATLEIEELKTIITKHLKKWLS